MGCNALTSTSREQAARAYAPFAARLDPTGSGTPESWAAFGQSFVLETDTGRGVFSMDTTHSGGECCWVDAAAGTGTGLTEAGIAIVEQKAKAAGCRRVAFQTMRRGLVRRVRRLGYQITGTVGRGFILSKEIA